MLRSIAVALAIVACVLTVPAVAEELKYETNFSQGADDWQPFDAAQWKVEKTAEGNVFSQFKKESAYKPPFRSPTNIALLKDKVLGDLEFTGKVKSTIPDYNHRDACVVFGYQDPAHFYYVHLGKKADDHANQIFIIDGEARKKISLTSTAGTNWDDNWHTVRVVRKVSGPIEIYFDDLTKPVMTANDTHFTWGQIGVGTFDDTCQWSRVSAVGTKGEKKKE
jgi:hypothetical protein